MRNQLPINERVAKNLKLIPKNLHGIYGELIENTLILPDTGNNSEYVELYKLLSDKIGIYLSNSNACIFEHDSSGVRTQFFRENKLDGRIDVSIPFHNVTNLIQLMALSLCSADTRMEYRKLLNPLYEDIPFIILADQVFSGNSLAGDCDALRHLLDLVGAPPKKIIAAVCRGTNAGIELLCKFFDSVIVVECIPDSMSVFSDKSKFFLLGSKGNEIRSLAKWFRKNLVPIGGLLERMEITLKDPEIGLWGVGHDGWLITTSSNTPNNSMPFLWYTPEDGKSVAPFPRVSSRLYRNDVWNIRPLLWDIIEKTFSCRGE